MPRASGIHDRLTPSRGTAARVSVALALLALLPAARAVEVPLLATPVRDAAGDRPEDRAALAAIESAVAAGLPSLAESLGADALAKFPAGSAALRRTKIAMGTARLQKSDYAGAEKILREIPGDGSDKTLRLALAACGLHRFDDSRTLLNAVSPARLPVGDLVWNDALQGLLAAEEGHGDAAEQFFKKAGARAVDPLTASQIALLRLRMRLRVHPADTSAINEIGKLVDVTSDNRQDYQLAKTRAFALYRAGKAAEAVKQLIDIPVGDADLRAERNLIVGLILGGPNFEDAGRSPNSQASLLRAVDADGFPEIQTAALAALRMAVITAQAGEANVNAHRIYKELTNRVYNGLTERARSSGVADLIDYTRALVMFTAAGNSEPGEDRDSAMRTAGDAIRDFPEKYPKSPLRADTLALTADIAWRAKSYRTAADALDKLGALVPKAESAPLRLVAADCYFLYGDYGPAAEAYKEAGGRLGDDTARGDALIGRIRSLLLDNDRVGDAAKALATATAPGSPGIDATSRLRADWFVADALRKAGETGDAMALVRHALGADPALDAGMRVRFLWLRAMIELHTGKYAEAVATAGELTRLVDSPAPDAPAEVRDNAPAILSQTALLKARALLEDKGISGAEIRFKELRENFPKQASAAASYLVEGRYLASREKYAEALGVFDAGYDKFKDETSPALLEQAASSLYEAANEALALADTEGSKRLQDAFDRLDTLTKRLAAIPRDDFEKHPFFPNLFFRARLMQGDILRRMNSFDAAEHVYRNLIADYPDHHDRIRAEIAHAYCLYVQATSDEKRADRFRQAAAEYDRLVNLPGRDPDLAAEAAYMRAEATSKAPPVGVPAGVDGAKLARSDAEKGLWTTITALLGATAETGKLGGNGRYWIGRGLILVSDLRAKNGDTDEARNALKRLLDYNAGLKDGTLRLPGDTIARNRLRLLSGKPLTLSDSQP